ncbi:MAG: sigma-70 family RNA polymerase sigma factor [Actinomycetota bacterium]|nr:sigma-70 family RNA polymerase sigma factor [Actinomycetota bacterium]
MEASALQAPAGLARTRVSIGLPFLRLRSDEQLVDLFRGGNDDAFRVIHDRYRQRLFAYTRQMLPGSGQDAEDALQDVFVRAYASLRSSNRDLALRAWLYRVAHNRCIDELRRPPLPAHDVIEISRGPSCDPIAEAEQRETLRRLIEDVRRLPEQQRSALLMRELSGMSYAELAAALSVSVPAVKSLLVRARIGLAKAIQARDTACSAIHEELVLAHDRGVRPSGTARRHLRDCEGCREFRGEVRGFTRQFAALAPALGPAGVLAKVLGIGGGAGASGSAAAGGSAAMAGGAAGTGGVLTAGGLIATGATHVATLLAAAVVTAGGAVGLANSISVPATHHAHHYAGTSRDVESTAATAKTRPVPATNVKADPGSAGTGSPAALTAIAAARAPSPVQRHGHPRPPGRSSAGGTSLPVSLDQGTFGLAPYPDGSPIPAPGIGSGSGEATGAGPSADGTSSGATGPSGGPISSTNGSPTGTSPGSPSSGSPGAGGSSTATPLAPGAQPIASTSSAGSNSTGASGSGSAKGAPPSGGPSSSPTG